MNKQKLIIMTRYETNQMIISNINRNINNVIEYTTYNRKSIMKHAHRLFKEGYYSFSECLKQAWESAKRVVIRCREELAGYKEQLNSFYTPEEKPISQEVIVNFFKNL